MHSFIYGVCGVLGFVVVLYLLLFVQCTVVVFSIMVQSFHRIRLKCKKLMTTDDIMEKVHMAFDQVSLKFEEEKKINLRL
jgi:hypothetical protein